MEIDEDAIIAWAEASARLAAELRRMHAADTAPTRPVLTLCPQPRPCQVAASLVVVWWLWLRVYPCICQWHLAFEIHPIFRAMHWGVAVAASCMWQLYDRFKPEPAPTPRHFSYIRRAT